MNIIFDINYFGLRAMNVSKLNSSSKLFLTSDDDKVEFLKKLKMDFVYELNKISEDGNITNVILATESKSWRKKVYPEYKANRDDKKIEFDSKVFFDIMDKFMDYVRDNFGVIKSKADGAEGDDLIYFWSKLLLDKKSNSLVITTDKDLYQLSSINEEKNYIAIYNNHSANKQIIVSQDLFEFISVKKDKKLSLVEQFKISKKDRSEHKDISDLVNLIKKDLTLKNIDKEEIMMEKIFLGDKSDNIPNILDIPPKDKKKIKNIKINRPCLAKMVTHLDSVLKDYKFTKILSDVKLKDECINFLSNFHNLSEEERFNMREQLEMNCKLTVLDVQNIPKEVQDSFIASLKALKNREPLNLSKLLSTKNAEFFKNILNLEIDDNEDEKIKIYFN